MVPILLLHCVVLNSHTATTRGFTSPAIFQPVMRGRTFKMAPDAAGLGSDSSSKRQRRDLCSNLYLSFCKVVCYLSYLLLFLPSLGLRLKTQFLHSVLPSCGKHDSSSVLEEGHVAANARRMSYHRRKKDPSSCSQVL